MLYDLCLTLEGLSAELSGSWSTMTPKMMMMMMTTVILLMMMWQVCCSVPCR